MKPEYIVVIVAGSLFVFLFLIYLIVSAHHRKTEERLRKRLDAVYSDKNLAKMEYDFAMYDDEVAARIAARNAANTQVTIYDVISDGKQSAEDLFGKIDSEGFEEITGNYKPD